MAALLGHILKTRNNSFLLRNITRTFDTISSSSLHQTPFILPSLSQVRLVGNAAESVCGFDEMVGGKDRKYYMLGGKGGVGKTSCAASLAVKFANHGHPTMVVSTDPAHSLSDSFAQDLTGGKLVPVEGVSSPLYALEINPDKSMEEFRTAGQKLGGGGAKSLMQSMGLGAIAGQLGELKLEEMLHTPPPGTDEIIAITKACIVVMQFLESEEYSMFSRIVFDTAPTGHTLRLLSLPDFLDGSIGKLIKMKMKLGSVFDSLLGKEQPQNNPLDKLEKLKENVAKIHDLFHNPDTIEFIIVTIPTGQRH
ncbi:arsenical pump-driving ATPase-like protein [Trifolium pratense]|uniref:Arsenical pump-driving ATPase-like protein n=1 Tax=Trifolium pratense TaxID=57577 RepID=A0A2K3NMY2_TRIPR|nr:arsenical pump-driving ATPase-like protein [Trifolium pratense]PNY04396.1 arsenical pump-driving ATPase-like protein [Trifolium pratense]PNY05016.1 arsenical pump-driving ATPase-like protein [Trifolium pratense]